MAIMKALFSVLSTVNGVTMDNPDGTNRQEIIANIKTGETILFHAEPWNEYDSEAIRLTTESGETVGYLPAKTKTEREFKSMVFESMKHGEIIGCAIRKPQEKPWYSLGLYVKFYFAPNEMFAERMLPEATAWKPEKKHSAQKPKGYSVKYKDKEFLRYLDHEPYIFEQSYRNKQNAKRRRLFKAGVDMPRKWADAKYQADRHFDHNNYWTLAEARERFMERRAG